MPRLDKTFLRHNFEGSNFVWKKFRSSAGLSVLGLPLVALDVVLLPIRAAIAKGDPAFYEDQVRHLRKDGLDDSKATQPRRNTKRDGSYVQRAGGQTWDSPYARTQDIVRPPDWSFPRGLHEDLWYDGGYYEPGQYNWDLEKGIRCDRSFRSSGKKHSKPHSRSRPPRASYEGAPQGSSTKHKEQESQVRPQDIAHEPPLPRLSPPQVEPAHAAMRDAYEHQKYDPRNLNARVDSPTSSDCTSSSHLSKWSHQPSAYRFSQDRPGEAFGGSHTHHVGSAPADSRISSSSASISTVRPRGPYPGHHAPFRPANDDTYSVGSAGVSTLYPAFDIHRRPVIATWRDQVNSTPLKSKRSCVSHNGTFSDVDVSPESVLHDESASQVVGSIASTNIDMTGLGGSEQSGSGSDGRNESTNSGRSSRTCSTRRGTSERSRRSRASTVYKDESQMTGTGCLGSRISRSMRSGAPRSAMSSSRAGGSSAVSTSHLTSSRSDALQSRRSGLSKHG